MTDYNQIAGGISGFSSGLSQGIRMGGDLVDHRRRRKKEEAAAIKEDRVRKEEERTGKQREFINEASFGSVAMPALFGQNEDVGPVDPQTVLEKAHQMGVYTDIVKWEPNYETGELTIFKKDDKKGTVLSSQSIKARTQFYIDSVKQLHQLVTKPRASNKAGLPEANQTPLSRIGMAYEQLGMFYDLSKVDAMTRKRIEAAIAENKYTAEEIGNGFRLAPLQGRTVAAPPEGRIGGAINTAISAGIDALPDNSSIRGLISRGVGAYAAHVSKQGNKKGGPTALDVQKLKRVNPLDLIGGYPGGKPTEKREGISTKGMPRKSSKKTKSVQKLKLVPDNPKTKGMTVDDIMSVMRERNPEASESEIIESLISSGVLMEK